MANTSTRGSKAKTQEPVERLARAIRTDYRQNLTDALPELMQPFTVAAVKFKALTKPFNANGKPTSWVAVYIDARMVAERLNHVVGAGAWTDEYRVLESNPAAGLPIECALSVLGVTKRDVGQIAPGKIDDKAWKSAYSDALKRAAVKFGIGLYLYKIPQLKGEVIVGSDGKAKGLTIQAQKALRETYQRWLDSDLNVFGAALDHGDPLPELVEYEQDVAPAQPNAAGAQPAAPAGTPETSLKPLDEGDRAATDDEIAALLEMAGNAGIREAVDAGVAMHRSKMVDGVVSAAWLGRQVSKVMQKMSGTDEQPQESAFQPPASATAETTAGDVAAAFPEAA